MSKEKNKELYKNGKPPWRHLLVFPICIVLWFASIVVGVYLDDLIYSHSQDTLGHPAAMFSILIPLGLFIIFVIVFVVAIIRYVAEKITNKKWKNSIN